MNNRTRIFIDTQQLNTHTTQTTKTTASTGAIALSYSTLLLLMTHHEETRLKALP